MTRTTARPESWEIAALRREALFHGDTEMVKTIDRYERTGRGIRAIKAALDSAIAADDE